MNPLTSGVSQFPMLREGDCLENKVAWLLMEIIAQAQRDAAKAINLGLVNPKTFKPLNQSLTCDEMMHFVDGAMWLKSEACEEACASLRAWSNFRIDFTPHKFVRLARDLAAQTTHNKNKKYIPRVYSENK